MILARAGLSHSLPRPASTSLLVLRRGTVERIEIFLLGLAGPYLWAWISCGKRVGATARAWRRAEQSIRGVVVIQNASLIDILDCRQIGIPAGVLVDIVYCRQFGIAISFAA